MPLLLVPVLVTGCIKDDFDDCDNVTIYFQYLADGDEDVLYRYMDKVDLYVFDESGHILGSGTYNQDQLSNFAAVPSFKLTPGKRYKVVAVGNAYDATQVVNLQATSFDDIYIQSPLWDGDGGNVVNTHDDNYLGQEEFQMPEGEFVVYRDTVTLYSAHIDTDIRITGLPAPSEAAAMLGVDTKADGDLPIRLYIQNSNAQTSFNNEINESEKGTIVPDLVWDADAQCYRTEDLALFRMDTNGVLDANRCQHHLVLEDANGNELVSGDIYDYLLRNQDAIDVTKQEALLPIEIHFTPSCPSRYTLRKPMWKSSCRSGTSRTSNPVGNNTERKERKNHEKKYLKEICRICGSGSCRGTGAGRVYQGRLLSTRQRYGDHDVHDEGQQCTASP